MSYSVEVYFECVFDLGELEIILIKCLFIRESYGNVVGIGGMLKVI